MEVRIYAQEKHVNIFALVCLAAVGIFVAIAAFGSDSSLSVSHYSVESSKIRGRIRLVLVTDLHSCSYGEGQIELLATIDAEKPDVVALCGDIFDDDLPSDHAIEFVMGISGRYPCYYVSGNHEFWSGKADSHKDTLAALGVKVLEGDADTLEIRDDAIRICGIDDPESDRYASRSAPYAEQVSRMGAASGGEPFTVLLSHHPERIDEFLPLKPDIVLSGHAHGGQWRLPFVLENGLLAPNQGLFPKYTSGKYSIGAMELIVSRGLARESTAIPRLFNRPEIVVVEIQAAMR
jgi:predicted MPP superfamily phosphohydrolase